MAKHFHVFKWISFANSTFVIIEEIACVSTATESATSASPTLPEDVFVPKSNEKPEDTRFIEMAPEDYEEFANALYETNYILKETTNCDSLGNPSKTIHQESPKDCRDLAKDGFRLEL
jgi:hypothetical protein